MIFELAHHVQSFLSEHNKPPPKSFHEEMLERQAQEKQQRLLEARQKEEQEVRSGCWCWPKPGGLQASLYLLRLCLWMCLWALLSIWLKKCAFLGEKSLQVHWETFPSLAILPLEPLSGLLRKSGDKEVGVVVCPVSLSLPSCTGVHWTWRLFSSWLRDVPNAQWVEEPGLELTSLLFLESVLRRTLSCLWKSSKLKMVCSLDFLLDFNLNCLNLHSV